MFKKATRKQAKLRLLLEGPSGSGKTYSSLLLAKGFNEKIAFIDTEKGSASLYSNLVDFDVCEITAPFSPEKYITAIKNAEENGYGVIIIDSISHEWSGDGGCLDIQSKLGGRYQDWAKVTPRHNSFINSIIQSDTHIIATARTKSDYLIDSSNGKMRIQKVGTKTEQRDGLEFEFTTTLRLNQDHYFQASKDRTGIFLGKDGLLTSDTSVELLEWLNEGENVATRKDQLDEWKTKLEGSENINELKDIWEEIPSNFKNILGKTKDLRKTDIEKKGETL